MNMKRGFYPVKAAKAPKVVLTKIKAPKMPKAEKIVAPKKPTAKFADIFGRSAPTVRKP